VPAPTRHIPFWVMGLAGRAMRWRAGLMGIEPLITDEVVAIYRHDWAFDSSRARRELGYEARSLREGLTATFAWLRELGQLP